MKKRLVIFYFLSVAILGVSGVRLPYRVKIHRESLQPSSLKYDDFGPYAIYLTEYSFLFNSYCELSVLRAGESPFAVNSYGFRTESPMQRCKYVRIDEQWTLTGLKLVFSDELSKKTMLEMQLPKSLFAGGR